jgi:hypothetical protein
VKSLRGEPKKKHGRLKDDDPLSSIYFRLTMAKYDQRLDPLLVQRSDSCCIAGGHEKDESQ